MFESEQATYWVRLYIAGDAAEARRECRRFCMTGLCGTVTETDFIYTGGAESGVCVGLANYPRFPSQPDEIWATALELSDALLDALCQHSVLLVDPVRTLWRTRRDI